jgi:selenocysteine lyase/cysteine desulfurase
MDERRIRDLFPETPGLVYLNAAAAGLLPNAVTEAAVAAIRRHAERGVLSVPEDFRAIAAARDALARLIGGRAEDIAFVLNTAEGIARIAAGLDWRPGDEVVLGDLEFPANVYPWAAQGDRGARIRLVPSEGGRLEAERLIGAMGPRTRVLAVSQVQFSSGYRMDLESLGRAAAERGVLFCVDAIQGLGVLPLDVRALGIGALAGDGRKWLMAPSGTGYLYVAPEWVERISARAIGAESVRNGLDFMQFLRMTDGEGRIDFRTLLREGAGRYEAGYYNAPGLAGLAAALSTGEAIGHETILHRVTALAARLADGLAARGFEVHGPRNARERAGIVTFDVQGDAREWRARLENDGFALALRDGRIRVSPHVYNTEDDIDGLLERLSSLRG